MSDTFTMPENEKAGTIEADAAHPLPDGTVVTETPDGELIANVPAKGGGFHRIGTGIGADPATIAATVAATIKALNCL